MVRHDNRRGGLHRPIHRTEVRSVLSVKAAATPLDPGGECDNVCGTVRRPSPRTVATDRFWAASVLGLSGRGMQAPKGDYRPTTVGRHHRERSFAGAILPGDYL